MARKQADEIVAQLAKGGDIATLAKAPVHTLPALDRSKLGAIKDAPQAILQQAFTLPRPVDGKPSWSVVRTDGAAYAIVAVDKVTDGDSSKVSKAERDGLRGQITAAMARAATSEYIEALRARGDVKIAQDRM